ncbi:hypothetical protein L6164_008279 [Bauhinia variegata]|uniref:Uncharacterized protein n=1 Tax=Bauhinia variegata TaxID=167791 RepID=A0ACB9PG56_BAUVA|nr:hypothetical protein L6164_008279 [Bauhinia variegata]
MNFQFSSCNPLQQHSIPQDLTLPSTQIDGKCPYNKSPKGRKRKQCSQEDDVQKKLMRRKIEKQRRQEMSILCTSLRSQLPLEYIKGKRSASDHMNEAAQYIKDLKNRIKELSAKRDKLRKLSNSYAIETDITTICADHAPANVSVHQCFSGFEVMLSGSTRVQMLPLSRVMDMLLKEGLKVVNCISTKAEHRWIHTIYVEVSDPIHIDCSILERKLEQAIPSLRKTSL